MRDHPVVSLYDRQGTFLDWLRAPVSLRATPRWLEPGTADLVVSPNDPRAALLRQPGARVQLSLRGDHVVGGPVTSWSTRGPRDESWSFHVTDDSAILERILAYPTPSAALTAQSPGSRSVAGPLETVVKTFIAENAPLLGVPIDIAADQGRGPVVTITGRWQPLSEVLLPHLRAAGMGLTVTWQPATNRLRMDVTVSRTYPIQLSVETRTITAYEISASAPRATRVILGPAEGTVFQQVINTPVETEWGAWLRGVTYRSAVSAEEQSTSATEALNDSGQKSGMSVSLAETEFVRYGGAHGLHVGDKATLRIGDVEVTDIVRECIIDWAAGRALTVTPAVGAWDQSPTTILADAVRRMGATIRRYVGR